MKAPRACGFLIVVGDPVEKFLLMKHADRWDLPKGHVDDGETDLQCALRELHEETGIGEDDIEIDTAFRHESRYLVKRRRYDKGKGTVEKTMRIFLGRLLRPVELRITEHEGFRWFPWNPPHVIQKKAIDPLLAELHSYLSHADQEKDRRDDDSSGRP